MQVSGAGFLWKFVLRVILPSYLLRRLNSLMTHTYQWRGPTDNDSRFIINDKASQTHAIDFYFCLHPKRPQTPLLITLSNECCIDNPRLTYACNLPCSLWCHCVCTLLSCENIEEDTAREMRWTQKSLLSINKRLFCVWDELASRVIKMIYDVI